MMRQSTPRAAAAPAASKATAAGSASAAAYLSDMAVNRIDLGLERALQAKGLTIVDKPEQADAVFGRPLGIPKTGVFGLYDLIGIDLMSDVVQSLVNILPDADPFHAEAAKIPAPRRSISAKQPRTQRA